MHVWLLMTINLVYPFTADKYCRMESIHSIHPASLVKFHKKLPIVLSTYSEIIDVAWIGNVIVIW